MKKANHFKIKHIAAGILSLVIATFIIVSCIIFVQQNNMLGQAHTAAQVFNDEVPLNPLSYAAVDLYEPSDHHHWVRYHELETVPVRFYGMDGDWDDVWYHVEYLNGETFSEALAYHTLKHLNRNIVDAWFADQTLYIDLHYSEPEAMSGGTFGEFVMYSTLVSSMASVPGIDALVILVDGQREATIGGHGMAFRDIYFIDDLGAASLTVLEAVPVSIPLPESTHPGYSWVLPPVYRWIEQFGDGYMRIGDDEGVGIMCITTGEAILPLKYQAIGWRTEYFPYYIEVQFDDRWGVINAGGEVVLPFEYVHISSIMADYGVAIVRCDNWNYSGIVELYTNRTIVPFGLYHMIWIVRDRFALAERSYGYGSNQHRTSSFIDITTGEEIVSSIQSNHSGFSEGRAAVQNDDHLWGFIDTTGEVVIPHRYDHITGSFTNGTIAVSRDGLWGIIDTTGTYILPPTHDGIQWPTNGFATFSTTDPISQNNYYGLLSMQTGEAIVPAIYQASFFVGEDIVLMRMHDWQNHDSNVLIHLETGRQFPFPFAIGDDIGYCGPVPPGFVDGVSVVYIIDAGWNRLYGIADNEGNVILPPIHNLIDRLPGGLFAISEGPSQWGIIDRDGQVVLPLMYCEIERTLGGRDPNHDISAIRAGGEWIQIESDTPDPIWRMEGALWGFVDINGQLAVPPVLEFWDVRTIGHSTAAVRTLDGLWGLIRIYGGDVQ